jgi:hypothetical protein
MSDPPVIFRAFSFPFQAERQANRKKKKPSRCFLAICPYEQLTTGAVYEGVFHTGCPTDATVRVSHTRGTIT